MCCEIFDVAHGMCIILADTKLFVKGSFINGLFHGHGVLEDYGYRRVFIGEFENGERASEGKETLSDGSRWI